jgi:hypothetical protein
MQFSCRVFRTSEKVRRVSGYFTEYAGDHVGHIFKRQDD